MSEAAALIQSARRTAGMTQAELAVRAGTTQTAISRLERPGSNPRLSTLQAVLAATGHQLRLDAKRGLPDVDETLVASHLRMTPAERAARHDEAYRKFGELAGKARRVG